MSQLQLFFELGLKHVLDWNAYDHVLFIIVLIGAYSFKDWRKVLWFVTLFTLGHTLSLVLSSYGVISANNAIVEFLIPVTILVTAIFNLFTAGKGGRNEQVGVLYAATIFFGIIHGLGFSSYFKMLVSGQEKLVPLLGFAGGIEVAQVIVVLVVLILSFLFQTVFRFNKRDWVLVMSSIVIGVVIPMLQRTWLW